MTYQTVEVLSEPTWEDVELSTLLGMDRMGAEVLQFLIWEETWQWLFVQILLFFARSNY
jgi:hypothetical protein